LKASLLALEPSQQISRNLPWRRARMHGKLDSIHAALYSIHAALDR